MLAYLSVLLLVQSSPVQYQAGVALAPGDQFGPVLRVTKSWPLASHFDFQIGAAVGMAGLNGSNTSCDLGGQCYTTTVRFRTHEVEIPAQLTLSSGPIYLLGGPVLGLRATCSGASGGIEWESCPGNSNIAWGVGFGAGVQLHAGAQRFVIEARSQRFFTPLLQLFTSDAGDTKEFKPTALTLTVGWSRR